jgi:hypothetical protein
MTDEEILKWNRYRQAVADGALAVGYNGNNICAHPVTGIVDPLKPAPSLPESIRDDFSTDCPKTFRPRLRSRWKRVNK